jgi:rod shape-determining protein MreC
MATFSSGSQQRGGSPGFRFTLYAIASTLIMFLDTRQGYLEQARYLLQGIAYPVQLGVSSPAEAINWLQQDMQAREVLQGENQRLRKRQLELELRVMSLESLARENGQLRGLRDALPPVADRWLAAEIVHVQLDNLGRQRILINRGSSNGVFKGQTVLDDAGVLGQTTRVGPWSAEVLLITDSDHAIPVMVERTSVRTFAFGAGDATSLALRDLPANADLKIGDRLVTSGLGGVFPAGYPVAKVISLHHDNLPASAAPYARITTDREVALVWFREGHPAAPVDDGDGDLKTGNPAMQPQQHVARQSASSASASTSPGTASAPPETDASEAAQTSPSTASQSATSSSSAPHTSAPATQHTAASSSAAQHPAASSPTAQHPPSSAGTASSSRRPQASASSTSSVSPAPRRP